ncbi:ScpA family protein [Thermoplasma sp.]|uniref:ScpA family protein n=1 Tax=Thermoplasma sp. TaxID=1973142 RepID=UPI00126D042C|nr:ScpA family protein [Thermoplasma sp.]KAA8922207.1 MAG: segregation/condensation protein A [Thermoplasma sp.]
MNVEEVIEDLIVQASDEDQAEYYRDLERSLGSRKVVDPSKAAVIKILEMCADGFIDPWNVDLTKFSQIMMNFTQGETIDFQFAGRALAEAWYVLRRKSDWSVREEQCVEDDVPEEYPVEIPRDIKPVDVTPVITVPFRRPVSLIEVIDQVRHNLARKQHVRQKTLPVSFSIDRLNSESPEEQIEKVMSIINGYPSDTMRMSEVWGHDRRDQASFFLYSLFLHHEGRIEMIQDNPNEDILIRKIH